MDEKVLALKKREQLVLPEKIICGGEFDGNHVNHGVE